MASFRRFDAFGQVEGAWQNLLPQCVTGTIFLEPSWQKAWWEEFGRGAELLLLALLEGGEVRGLAPLQRRGGLLTFVGDRNLCDYHDFILPRGLEAAFYPALLDYLDGEEWETLHLASIPEGSPTLVHLPPLAEGRGYRVEVTREDVAPGLPLPGGWEAYLGSLTKKDRHELRRKLRRLTSAGEVRYYARADPSTLEVDLGDFLRLLRISREEKSRFLTPERERFFRAVARETCARGHLRLFFLELRGERVASGMCFDYGGARLLYNSGFDPEYSYFSVGLLLKALCLKEAIETGKDYFDFLRGSEPYKYDLGGRDRNLYQLVLRRG
jgi:CelD/BcsL family acetyltransferase involved in cellulose biosynthesis